MQDILSFANRSAFPKNQVANRKDIPKKPMANKMVISKIQWQLDIVSAIIV